MKKGIKVSLAVNKVKVSQLNYLNGGNGSGCTSASVVELCVITTVEITVLELNCRTGATEPDRSLKDCLGIFTNAC